MFLPEVTFRQLGGKIDQNHRSLVATRQQVPRSGCMQKWPFEKIETASPAKFTQVKAQSCVPCAVVFTKKYNAIVIIAISKKIFSQLKPEKY